MPRRDIAGITDSTHSNPMTRRSPPVRGIAAVPWEGPVLRRIAVGEHLILGGDNMDAALARRAEERLLQGGRKLTAAQWGQLVQGARAAKESLLSDHAPEQLHLSVVAEGSRLMGGSLSTQLTRAEAEQLILNGFFPTCAPDEKPERSPRVALQEIGLPYAADPAITRHLAAFLRAHAQAGFTALGEGTAIPGRLPRPDAVLLNGGVFNSPKLAERLLAWLKPLDVPALLGDPGRNYFPKSGIEELARYKVQTTRDLEDREIRDTGVYKLIRD